jgi:hypothetical protein
VSESSGRQDAYPRHLGDHNKRQEFEHQLIDRRLTWLLSSQAILFAAFGLTLTETASSAPAAGEFQDAVVLVGLLTSVLTSVSVGAAYVAKWISWRKYRKYFGNAIPEPWKGNLSWGANTVVTVVAAVADLLMPIVLVVVWLRLW